MLQRMLLRYWLLVLLLGVLVSFLIVSSDSEDQREYRALVESSRASADSGSSAKDWASRQRREGVQKNLWVTRDDARLQVLVQSARATLDMERSDGRSSLVERMDGVQCWMQEKLLADTQEQLIRYFEADTASFRYDSSRLSTDEMRIKTYRAPGMQLPAPLRHDTLSMSAVADSAELKLKGADLEFSAERLRASFFEEGKAQQPQARLKAQRAIYSDKQLHLLEAVRLDQAQGTMTCDQARLVPGEDQGLSRLKAQGRVVLDLAERGLLHCDFADIDLKGQEALFEARRGKQVSFKSSQSGDSGRDLPILIQADQLAVELRPESGASGLRSLEARGRVSLLYDQVNRVEAGYAKYIVDPQSGTETMRLVPSAEQPCLVRDAQGNQIRAEQIDVCMDDDCVSFLNPVCDFFRTAEDGRLERMNVVAKQLTWLIREQLLILEDAVRVEQVGTGVLLADEYLSIAYSEDDGQRELVWMQSDGRTELRLLNGGSDEAQTLLCHGKARIDHRERLITLSRPDDGGQGGREVQVSLSDRAGFVKADHLQASYTGQQRRPELDRLTLSGNVLIHNDAPLKGDSDKPVLQYGLADKLEYSPRESRMELSAEGPSGRVLYYDEIEQVRMSAPLIVVQRDQLSKQDSVSARGDVRFTFLSPELERLNRVLGNTKASASLEEEDHEQTTLR